MPNSAQGRGWAKGQSIGHRASGIRLAWETGWPVGAVCMLTQVLGLSRGPSEAQVGVGTRVLDRTSPHPAAPWSSCSPCRATDSASCLVLISSLAVPVDCPSRGLTVIPGLSDLEL